MSKPKTCIITKKVIAKNEASFQAMTYGDLRNCSVEGFNHIALYSKGKENKHCSAWGAATSVSFQVSFIASPNDYTEHVTVKNKYEHDYTWQDKILMLFLSHADKFETYYDEDGKAHKRKVGSEDTSWNIKECKSNRVVAISPYHYKLTALSNELKNIKDYFNFSRVYVSVFDGKQLRDTYSCNGEDLILFMQDMERGYYYRWITNREAGLAKLN